MKMTLRLHSSPRCSRFFCWHWRCWRMKPTFWIWKLIGRRPKSNLPQIQILCQQQFQYQAIQWTLSSLLSTSARKFTSLVDSEPEVWCGIDLVKSCFNQLNREIWCSSISISTKVQLYHVYIQPILLYGSETWALTRATEDRMLKMLNFTLIHRI